MKKLLTLFILLLFTSNLFSQEELKINQAGKPIQIKFVPPEYLRPHIVIKPQEDQNNTDMPWRVYSDRQINQTFTSAGGNNAFKTPGFLQAFYVVEQRGDLVHIYEEAEGAEGSYTLSKDATDFGWVNKTDLLLWRRCLYTETEVSLKAIVIKDKAPCRFFLDPKLKTPAKSPSNHTSILYVYKLFPTVAKPLAALVGLKEYISGEKISEEILGWVDYKKIIILHDRVFTIPNNLPEAISERKNNNIKSKVFKDINTAKAFASGRPTDPEMIAWNGDYFAEFYPGSYMRFPVLWNNQRINENAGVMKLVVIDTIRMTGLPGYAPLRKPELKSELWLFELLFPSDEFFEFKKAFEKLTESMSMPERRKLFSNAWRQILLRTTGTTPPNYETITIGEIESLVFGLPGLSEFTTLKLSDLDDPVKLSNEKLSLWQSSIEKKAKILNKIWNGSGGSQIQYSFDKNDSRYFWIPQSLLP